MLVGTVWLFLLGISGFQSREDVNVTFLIIGPVYWQTGDAVLAWRVGLAWCVIEAVIEILGFVVGPYIRKHTPRASMLAVLGRIPRTIAGACCFGVAWKAVYESSA